MQLYYMLFYYGWMVSSANKKWCWIVSCPFETWTLPALWPGVLANQVVVQRHNVPVSIL